MKTDVIFRKVKYDDGQIEILALFPHESYNNIGDTVNCYAHIGQHSGANYTHMIHLSKLAKKMEYVDLETELIILGYDLNVMKRRNYNKFIKSKQL